MMLVTGAAGRLGNRLVRRLADEGAPFVAVDLVPARGVPDDAVEVMDIRDARLADVVRERGVKTIVHLAFSTDAKTSEAERRAVDVDGSRNVLDAALAADVRSIVLASSGRVYGDQSAPGGRLDNDGTYVNPGPDLYAAHKLEVEDRYFAAAAEHGIDVAVLRISAICDETGGVGMGDQIRMAARTGRYMVLRGHDPQVRLVHIDDVCDAILAAAGKTGIFDVASDGALPINEVFARAARYAGKDPKPIRLREKPTAMLLGAMWKLGFGPIPPLYLRFMRLEVAKPNLDKTHEVLGAPNHTIDDILEAIAADVNTSK